MNPSQQIDKMIADAPAWQSDLLASLRNLIHEADPEIIEQWKWFTAVFAHGGNVCAIAAFKDHVKLNFFAGAALPDPAKVINAGLDSKASRAIDFHQGDEINEQAVRDLVRAAVALNPKKPK
jgi:hypothetical protein